MIRDLGHGIYLAGGGGVREEVPDALMHMPYKRWRYACDQALWRVPIEDRRAKLLRLQRKMVARAIEFGPREAIVLQQYYLDQLERDV
jgi:hypothetical protein